MSSETLNLPTGPAGEALREALGAMRRSTWAQIPLLSAAPSAAVARWLYRHWQEEAPGWAPFLSIEGAHLASLRWDDPDWWSWAAGGVLYLDAPPPPHLVEKARATPFTLLSPSSSPPLPCPPEWVTRLLQRDELHSVAVDPGLTRLRAGLLSQCRGLGSVHLQGEAGTEKALLAQWAHSCLDDRPLSHVRGAHGRPRPGEWALYEEVAELGPDQRRTLIERLRALEPSRPPPLASSRAARPPSPLLSELVGESPALAEALGQLLRLAPHPMPVLIQGEPGVGKELFARALHALSGRRGPFVALDMGAIPEALAESELFGHRKGAFSGAERNRPGAFRQAHGGTLLLDEIGNTPPSLQAKLLRALQQGMISPLGEDEPVAVDVRIVAATNADLRILTGHGSFRQDLYDRLAGATLGVPPLRERLEDVEPLARHFLGEALGGPPPTPWCVPEVLTILRAHRWPGNVRELGNVIKTAAALAPRGEPITPEHLGALSPRLSRRTATLTTSTRSAEEDTLGLDAHLAQLMTAVTFTLPPLRDRLPESRRAAVLAAVDGRPIHRAALRLLESEPWWGNHQELEARLSALRTLPPGGIDTAALRTCLPDLAMPAAHAPIRILLSPTGVVGGRIEGFTREIAAGAVLLGRVRRLEELEALAREGDERATRWLEVIERTCGQARPTCLELGMHPRISRAHVLITRSREGLLAQVLPSVGLPVAGSPLEGDPTLRHLSPGAALPLGRGGELQFLGRGATPYLQLFAFLGAVAAEELAPAALERARTPRDAAPPTLQLTAALAIPTPDATPPGLHVWPLTSQEVDALTELVGSFQGGQLKAHVARSAAGWRGAELERLRDYLERAPRLSQYLVRLYELPTNQRLRDLLRERLSTAPDRETRLAMLPVGLRRFV